MQVIFVDADQIVRTDMGELYDMDLKGRPLAYTPFCDNNREMDGYRFWKQVLAFSIIFFTSLSAHSFVLLTENRMTHQLFWLLHLLTKLFTCSLYLLNRASGRSIYEEDHIILGIITSYILNHIYNTCSYLKNEQAFHGECNLQCSICCRSAKIPGDCCGR